MVNGKVQNFSFYRILFLFLTVTFATDFCYLLYYFLFFLRTEKIKNRASPSIQNIHAISLLYPLEETGDDL